MRLFEDDIIDDDFNEEEFEDEVDSELSEDDWNNLHEEVASKNDKDWAENCKQEIKDILSYEDRVKNAQLLGPNWAKIMSTGEIE